jgi:acetyltransferase-like isoleucine patch superfamily enzyme
MAVKLPIWIYKIRLLSSKGVISIESDHIHTGMIRLGFPRCATYPNSGITWRNRGKIVFKGRCIIGNDCYIIVGKQGLLIFGDDFKVNAGMKLVSECSITFGNHTLIGWGVIITDTNFHYLYDIEKGKCKGAFSPILIGNNNWFATQCYIMQGVRTPDNCVFGARSIVTRGGHYESNCVYGGSPIQVLSRNVIRDYKNDLIKDYTLQGNEFA